MQTKNLRKFLHGMLPLALVLAGVARAQVQPDWVTPAIPGVVAGGLQIEQLGEGFEGSEGPLGLPDGSFLFTETRAQRIVRIAHEDKARSVYLEQSNGANGLALNAAGELVAVQVNEPRVGIVYPVGHDKVLADNWNGKPFTRPNDLVLGRNGDLFFTDSGNNPNAQVAGAAQPESAGPAVYRVTAAGELQQLAADIARPNGIQLSKDERTLYVANTQGAHILAFALDASGKVPARREFAALRGWDADADSSGADGLAVDAADRLFVASNAGIEVFSADGNALGVIPLPVKPQNLAFAGPRKSWLYVVGSGKVYRLPTLTSGPADRAK